jgi:hypothetical protein
MADSYKLSLDAIPANTEAGKAWARKYLHPPGPRPTGYAGIPDDNNSPSVHAEYRLFDTLSTPTVQWPAVGPSSKSMLYMCLPSMKYPVLQAPTAAAGALKGNLWSCDSAGGLGQTNNNLNLTTFISEISSLRCAAKSTTFYLNTNALSNKGTITVGKTRAPIVVCNLYDLPTFANRDKIFADALECATKHAKKNNDHKALTVLEDRSLSLRDKLAAPTTLAFTIQYIKIGKIINTADLISMVSPSSQSYLAVEGAFCVSKFSQPISRFKDIGVVSGPNTQFNGYTRCAYTAFDGTNEYLEWITPNGTADNFNTALQDLPWTDMTADIVLFENVDEVSSVSIKTVMDWEFQPAFGSNFAPFQTLSALPDRLALESVSTIMHRVPDCMPQVYNDGDDLVKSDDPKRETIEVPEDVARTVGVIGSTSENISRPKLKPLPQREKRAERKIEKKVEKVVERKEGRPAQKARSKSRDRQSTSSKNTNRRRSASRNRSTSRTRSSSNGRRFTVVNGGSKVTVPKKGKAVVFRK